MDNQNKIQQTTCRICGSLTRNLMDVQIRVTYSVCDECGFIYKNLEHHMDKESEHKEYLNHNNNFESIGYVKMFESFIEDFITPLSISGKVLEYGSGPGPVLKELLRRQGYDVYNYDPFFSPNTECLNQTYDLITSTEVVEHFVNPLEEFIKLKSLLNESGYLVLMTNFSEFNEPEFLKWWYRRDTTHISFYKIKTFEFLAFKLNLRLVSHNSKNVIIFKKQEGKILVKNKKI
ncbi:MAG: class I SAM-dependent methyltransferase [Tenericutes bacterium]|nr:class I SAM-dependent methyltransferase [Mycoplasmatota bacterium]